MSDDIKSKLVELIKPYAKNAEALNNCTDETSFLKDLQVSSSRLVDIVLAIEDNFGFEISDAEADKISTIGEALALIRAKQA